MKKITLLAIIALTAFTGCAHDYSTRGYTNPLPATQYRNSVNPSVTVRPSTGYQGYNFGDMSFHYLPTDQSHGYRPARMVSCVQVDFMTSCY